MQAVRINEYGGPEKLYVGELPVPTPGPQDILIKIAFSGINFMDVYTRRGVYAGSSPYASELPLTLGVEGSGWVESIGTEIKNFHPGDRVVFCLSRGSYAQYALVPQAKVVALPDDIELDLAAAGYFQGLTAHYLAYDTSKITQGTICLIYSGSGGVANNLIQIAKHQKAVVIATCSTQAKCAAAKQLGADHVCLSETGMIKVLVNEVTEGRGVDVLFDSVGAALFDTSLTLIKRKGLFVYYGANSDPIRAIDPMRLANSGSLYFVRPRLNDHILTRQELLDRSASLFLLWRNGIIKKSINKVYELDGVADAHALLEGRNSIGKSILSISKPGQSLEGNAS